MTSNIYLFLQKQKTQMYYCMEKNVFLHEQNQYNKKKKSEFKEKKKHDKKHIKTNMYFYGASNTYCPYNNTLESEFLCFVLMRFI